MRTPPTISRRLAIRRVKNKRTPGAVFRQLGGVAHGRTGETANHTARGRKGRQNRFSEVRDAPSPPANGRAIEYALCLMPWHQECLTSDSGHRASSPSAAYIDPLNCLGL